MDGHYSVCGIHLSRVFCADILHILQVNHEIFKDAYAYLVVIFAGIPFTLLYNYLSAILRAIGDSKTPFFFLAFSAVLNIGLEFFLYSCFEMGMCRSCHRNRHRTDGGGLSGAVLPD